MSAIAMILAVAAMPPAAEPYIAHGADPSWTLTIADGRMTYEEGGRPAVSVAAPRPRTEEGETLYDMRPLNVRISPMACSDEASGRRYADTVSVTVDRALHDGCGGEALSADSLNGTSWHFAEIGGEAVPLTGDLLQDDAYAIDFWADGFLGYSGCNRFSARYSRSGDMLTAMAPWGRTVGTCSEPVMIRERKLFQILSQPVRISFPDVVTMLLTNERGTIRLRRTPPQSH